MLERPRPLSPFLHYRWQYTNTLSILHRLSGLFLSGGFVVLVYWITSLGRGPAAYERASVLLANPLVKMLLKVGVVALAYHVSNGIRHLLWDAGFGLERREARRSARIVVVATILIVTFVLLFFLGGEVS